VSQSQSGDRPLRPLPIVALVSRTHQQLIGRRPLPKRITALMVRSNEPPHAVLAPLSGSIPTSGQVTYALTQPSPLTIRASPDRPRLACLMHAAALILSQDQTLLSLRSSSAATSSEGLTTRTSITDSCHSSLSRCSVRGKTDRGADHNDDVAAGVSNRRGSETGVRPAFRSLGSGTSPNGMGRGPRVKRAIRTRRRAAGRGQIGSSRPAG